MRFSFHRGQDVVLEPVDRDRADVISQLHLRCFGKKWSDADIAGLLTRPGVFSIEARRVGKPNLPPLAFVVYRLAADEAEILSIGVAPEHRGKGLARRLMEEVMRRLHGERARSLFLEVDSSNEPAIKLYRRLRFQTVAERPAYYKNEAGNKSAALVMRLDLV